VVEPKFVHSLSGFFFFFPFWLAFVISMSGFPSLFVDPSLLFYISWFSRAFALSFQGRNLYPILGLGLALMGSCYEH